MLGGLEGVEDTVSDLEGLLHGLQPRGVRSPGVVAEVGVGHPGGHDQAIEAQGSVLELDLAGLEIDGDDIVYKNHYDIGVAVGSPQGLVVPVVRDADALSFADIEKSIADFGRRARDGKLALEDLQGGTFTITNGGVFGSLLSTPILNPPQSGILGMHKIQKRPMVTADDSIAARPMMYLALSYDHRIVDGREAVSFLVRVKECIEDPQRIMLDA